MEIKERANNKIWAKITTAEFYLKDLQKEYRKGHYLGMLTEEELSSIKVIESKLAKIIGEKYDISMDDLYQEGE